jgi:hypothetical protein
MVFVLVAVVVIVGFAWYAWKDQDQPFGNAEDYKPAAPPQLDHCGAPDKPLPLPLKIIKKIIPKRSHHKKP